MKILKIIETIEYIAMQLEEIEAVRLENYFSDGIKGLNIYGAKVIRPDHLGVVFAQFSGLTT